MPLKPFLTFNQQAELLVNRGMSSINGMPRQDLVSTIEGDLTFINYYRFSAYWYPFYLENQSGEKIFLFGPDTYWETVRSFYMFDRRLRRLMFDAISRIEIALRTQIAYIWAKRTGVSDPQREAKNYRTKFTKGKKDPSTKQLRKSPYMGLLEIVDDYYQKNRHSFTEKFTRTSAKHAKDLPIWEFVEYATFGNLATLLEQGLPLHIVDEIANVFGFPNRDGFLSCVALLKEVRNACAHHGRLWNKTWTHAQEKLQSNGTIKLNVLDILKKLPFSEWDYVWDGTSRRWRKPRKGEKGALLHASKSRTAAVLTVCNILLKAAASRSHWKDRLCDLLTNQDAPLPDMYVHLGFTNSRWHEHPLWK